jgi:uncharacterized protein YbcI
MTGPDIQLEAASDQVAEREPIGTLPAHAERTASLAVKISNLVVQAFRAHTGRGPTKARTSIESNLITVVLRDTLTSGERSLVAAGHVELVLEMRRTFQRMMREELVSGLETLTSRKVSAFLSDNTVNPDVAVETFVLEPYG